MLKICFTRPRLHEITCTMIIVNTTDFNVELTEICLFVLYSHVADPHFVSALRPQLKMEVCECEWCRRAGIKTRSEAFVDVSVADRRSIGRGKSAPTDTFGTGTHSIDLVC